MDNKNIQKKVQTKETTQKERTKQTSNVSTQRKNLKISQTLRKEKINWNFPFTKKNFIIAAIGFVVILIGYILMATGISNQPALESGTPWNNPFAVTIAPILLLIGYCIIIPYAIIKYFGKDKDTN